MNFDRYLEDPMAFRNEQLILSDGRRLGEALEDWQRKKVFDPLDELQDDGRYRYRLCYFELPRGHAKTTMVAGEALTQLVLGGYDWRGHIAAGDKEQARELFDAAVGFIRRNPLLDQSFQIHRDRISAPYTGSSLRVHSADAPTAHGLIVDFFVLDEFWNQPNRDLFDSFYTAAVKRPNWRGVLTTTAGFDKESICWEVRELARRRDDFYAFIAPGRLASWITDEEVERMRETLPPHVYQRFVENVWTEGSGSFVTKEALKRCFDDRLSPQPIGDPRNAYYIGIDLGLTKDRTAAAVLHRSRGREVSGEGQIVLDDLVVWEGRRGAPVQIRHVEDWLDNAVKRFPTRRVVMDPWQAQSTIQKYGGRIEEFTFTAHSVGRLSSNLYHLIQTGQLRMFPDKELERELLELHAEQTSYGWRIDHGRNKHDDMAMAIGMAALSMAEEGPAKPARQSRANFNGPKKRVHLEIAGKVFYIDKDGALTYRERASWERR
ncbi:MAG: phage terminase family protein [Actinobacteria bacterium]|nr:phage terminase family protein [Actinomycetota bacterium]